MKKVFISGSLQIKQLDENVKERLKYITENGFEVIVGDADGVDSAIQSFLFQNEFQKVTVYCSGMQARNNLGRWSVKTIVSNFAPNSRAFFTAKDLAMAQDCDFGLMIWDTKSTGTLSNVIELLKLSKKSKVYINKKKEFFRVASSEDVSNLLQSMSKSAYEKANEKIKFKQKIDSIKNRTLSLF